MNGKSNKVTQLFTLQGSCASSTSTVGFTLYATLMKTNPTKLRIPHGMKLKIWEKNIYTTISTDSVTLQYAHDGSSTSPTWVTIDKQPVILGMVTGGMININKRRPIVLDGLRGTEAIQFLSGNSATSISYEVEITDE